LVTSLWRAQMRSLPLWKFQLGFKYFFKCFGLRKKPHPKEIPYLQCEGRGEEGYFIELQNGNKVR